MKQTPSTNRKEAKQTLIYLCLSLFLSWVARGNWKANRGETSFWWKAWSVFVGSGCRRLSFHLHLPLLNSKGFSESQDLRLMPPHTGGSSWDLVPLQYYCHYTHSVLFIMNCSALGLQERQRSEGESELLSARKGCVSSYCASKFQHEHGEIELVSISWAVWEGNLITMLKLDRLL